MRVYVEEANIEMSDASANGKTKVVAFAAGAGGSGCSIAASAYAAYLASKKNRVLYLDLHSFGMPELIFSDTGNHTMTDCITAIINQKNNLGMLLKSYVRKDQSGVYFYESCVNPMDWFDVSDDNCLTLIHGLIDSSEYDYIIIDAVVERSEVLTQLFDICANICVVSDGTTFSNKKAQRVWQSAITYYTAQHKDISKLYLVYSCFASGAKKITDDTVREKTTLPFVSGYHNAAELVKSLSARSYWE